MFALFASIKNLFNAWSYPAQDRDDRYLAEASDIYDLERRMREIDSGREHVYAIGAHGVFVR